MVHGNAVFIREEAKQARNTHRYAFSTLETYSILSTPLTSQSINQTTPLAARNYLLWFGTYRGAESFAFSQRLARFKKVAQ